MVPQCYASPAPAAQRASVRAAPTEQPRGGHRVNRVGAGPHARKTMKRITSRQNPLVARYRAIARGDVRDLLLLDGLHLVSEALEVGIRLRQVVVSGDAPSEVTDLVLRLTQAGVEVVVASGPVMDVLSPVRSSSAIVAI